MENTSFLHGKQIDKAVALLGGTKFELDRKTLDSTYYSLGYKLDGITCYKNNEYRAISVPNVPKELLKLLESSPYRGTYFTICGKDVLITSLEGLVYLDTLITAKSDDLEEEFNKNTRRVRLQLLNEILAASSVVDNAIGDNNTLRDELNLFDRLAFGPLVVDDEESIPKYLDNYYFNYTGFYKKGATNDCIEVDWSHKSQKIMGKFSRSEESKQAIIAVNDDDSPTSENETLTHQYDSKYGEYVMHVVSNRNGIIVYNISKRTKKEGSEEKEMTEEDYKALHGLLSWFINSAQDEFNQGSYSAENIGMVEEKGHGKH